MGNNGSNFSGNLNNQTSNIYKNEGGRAGGHEQGQEDQLVIYKERGRDLV
jgi:hypothetical protein